MSVIETIYTTRLTRSRIPAHVHEGLVNYLVHRSPPGGFLRAVLENNLRLSCVRADDSCRTALVDLVLFLNNEAPMSCWGSPTAVAEWLAQRETEAAS